MSKKMRNYNDDYIGLGNVGDYEYYYGNADGELQRSDRPIDRRHTSAHSDADDQNEPGVHRKKKMKTGTIYLLMTGFFVIMIVTVLIGRIYVRNFIHSKIESGNTPVVSPADDDFMSEPEPEPVDPAVQKIEEELSAMTLEQKVGQLFMVRNNGGGSFKDTVSKTHAGAAILFAGDFKNKTPEKVRKMIEGLQKASDGRMIIAVDEEGGAVVRISSNPKLRKSAFLSPQALFKKGGLKKVKSDTEEKCKLLDSLGINMNMAPVADVCTSKKGFMYNRAFGKGADETAEYVSTVVSTMNKTPVASCVKHFPGYGNSKKDTHKGLDINKKSLEKLEKSDLVPFERAIDDGVDSILLTHTVVNAFDPIHPASLSSDVVNYIRVDMSFDGLLITDGLEMGAIIKYSGDSGKACVMAVKAGVDILCAPKNPIKDYKAVLEAVKSGEITEERIDESVRRILRFKQRFPEPVQPEVSSTTESDTESTEQSTTEMTTVTTTQSTTQTTAQSTSQQTTVTGSKPGDDGAVG